MKRIFMFIAVCVIVFVLAGRLFAPPAGVTSAPSVEQLKPLAGLLTHRAVVVDVVTVGIAGYTGGLKASVIVRGDALLSVDLTRATIGDVDHEARTLVLMLPLPQVVSARLDHEGTRIVAIESSGLWALMPSDDARAEIIDHAMLVAQDAVMKAASESLVIEQARVRAEAMIVAFFTDTLKWLVIVRWVDKPDGR